MGLRHATLEGLRLSLCLPHYLEISVSKFSLWSVLLSAILMQPFVTKTNFRRLITW